jgi:uncharacterized protein DUF1697
MARYVALLRGINVGGSNIIRMADLRACLEADGLDDVRTEVIASVPGAGGESRIGGHPRFAEVGDLVADLAVRAHTRVGSSKDPNPRFVGFADRRWESLHDARAPSQRSLRTWRTR